MKEVVTCVILIVLTFCVSVASALEYSGNLYLDVGEMYNDNIFLDSTNEVDDFITYVTPGIEVSARSASADLRIGYSPTFYFYTSNSDENNTAHRFFGTGLFTLSERTTFTIDERFIMSDELRDFSTLTDIGPIRTRTTRRYNTLSGTLSHRLSGNLESTLILLYSDSDTEAADTSEVKSYSGSLGLSYKSGERTTYTANAKYTKDDFRPDSDTTRQDYTVGVNYNFSPTFSAGLTGGVVISKVEDLGSTDAGFTGRLTVTKSFERASVSVNLFTGVTPSTDDGQLLDTKSAAIVLTRNFTDRLTGNMSASYFKYKSIESSDTDQESVTFTADLGYLITPWAAVNLSYNYVNFNDKISETGDYRNNIVALGLRFMYGTRTGTPGQMRRPY